MNLKNLEATLLFKDFSIVFGSIPIGKIEQIHLTYGLPKETDAGIMILYKNMKAMVHSPDNDTVYFDIVNEVLQGDILRQWLLSA